MDAVKSREDIKETIKSYAAKAKHGVPCLISLEQNNSTR
jgi:hypothetical protein